MKSQTAIITGATGGLGDAFASHLAQQHFNLLLTGRNAERLGQLKDSLQQQFGVKVVCVTADLTKTSDLDRLIGAIKLLDSVDLLVNNAGFGNNQNFFDSDYTDQLELLNIHVMATTRLIHAVVPLMALHGGGAIINVSSLAAFLPSGQSYFYCSSKAFMVAFTECLHVDLCRAGIYTQVLCPGFVDTAFHANSATSKPMAAKHNKWLWMCPEKVVRYSLQRLRSSNVVCIPGWVNKLIYFAGCVLPRPLYYLLSSTNTNHTQFAVQPLIA